MLYQGFQYEGYSDYYADDIYGEYGGHGNSSFDSYDVGGRTDDDDHDRGHPCFCLFAPFVAARRRSNNGNSKDALSSEALPMEDGTTSTTTTIAGGGSHVASDGGTAAAAAVAARDDADATAPPPSDPPSPIATDMTKTTIVAPDVDNMHRAMTESPSPVKLFGDGTPLLYKPEVPSSSSSDDDPDDAPCMPILVAGDSSSSGESATVVVPKRTTSFTSAGLEKKEEDEEEGRRDGRGDDGCGGDKDGTECGNPTRPIKGILKVRRCSTASMLNATSAKNDNGKKAMNDAKSSTLSPTGRKLFPTYEPKTAMGSGTDSRGNDRKSIQFNPMARVLTVPSRRDVPLYQRAQVWWQKSDYDEFKKTGRIISKAMECGGSEIWLTSSNAWGDRAARGGRSASTAVPDKGGGGGNDDNEAGTNKWWCKFGHSRRGLEHVVSSAEGRARQQSVLLATRMVLEEQRRQRSSRMKDPNKLRNVAMQYTSWARDLSLANGYADAEAVSSNFDTTPWDGSRARHFAKRMNIAGGGGGAVGSVIAALLGTAGDDDVVPGGGARAATTVVTSQMLDANTHKAVAPPPVVPTKTSAPTTTAVAGRATSLTMTRVAGDGSASVDQDHSSEGVSLKKRAKGFMPGSSGDEVPSMMGGMGGMGYRSVKA